MLYLITALIILLVPGVAFYLIKKSSLQADNEFPYQKIHTLLSPAERSLLGVIEKSLGSGYRVLSKIRLCDVVEVKKGLSRYAERRALHFSSTNYVEFLICRANDMSIRGAVELDDRTDNTPQGVRRDHFVDKVLKVSRIPLLRVKPMANYSISEITRLLEHCGIIENKSIQGQHIKDKNGVENGIKIVNTRIESSENAPTIELEIEVVCPRCGAGLVEKVATKGRYAGRKYLGCSNFPTCRYAEGVNKHKN